MHILFNFCRTISPSDVETGESILAAAAAAGVYIPASCGGEAVCGKCRIQVETG